MTFINTKERCTTEMKGPLTYEQERASNCFQYGNSSEKADETVAFAVCFHVSEVFWDVWNKEGAKIRLADEIVARMPPL